MPQFRKKPVVIEAEQFWIHRGRLPFADRQACCLGPEGWYVVTAHGREARIMPGDWIIPEPDGRGFYPCKPDIFEATYEPVNNPIPAYTQPTASDVDRGFGVREAPMAEPR